MPAEGDGAAVTNRSDAANPSAASRLCLGCGNDSSSRSPKALRCRECADEHEKERAKERARSYYHENRGQVLQRVKAYQQTPAYKRKLEEWKERNPEKLLLYRDRKRQSHRAKTGYNPEGRKCQKCRVSDISVERGHRARYCDDCAKPQARTCEVCGEDITRQKRLRLPYCRGCEREYWRLKEDQGYMKVCTKCKEEKPHTDFGFHSGRRRSACKCCEVVAAQHWYQGLAVEERQERRRVQGRRERDRVSNLPLEQKEMRRNKLRKDAYRRQYGPDFDEDRLYSEQGCKCAIYREPVEIEDLEVDHDHETHTRGTMHSVRGLLCKNCNLKLVSGYEKFPSDRQDWPYMNEYLARGKQR